MIALKDHEILSHINEYLQTIKGKTAIICLSTYV